MNTHVKSKPLDPMWQYVIFSYLLFWAMVLGICGTASMVFHVSPLTMRILSNITAWSPTMLLLIMFKKLKPNTPIKAFYKNAFSAKIKFSLLLFIPILITGSMLLAVLILSLIEHREFTSYFSLGTYPLVLSIVLCITTGPTGEESGWRGYLRPKLNARYGFLKGSIYQGIIWAFWHTILWFVDSEFLDFTMIPYILSNIIVLTALTLIMNIILEKHNNLIYAIWIHFCFNLPYSFLQVNITFYIILSVIFIFVASIYYLYARKSTPFFSSPSHNSL